jgi:hypothetical protein
MSTYFGMGRVRVCAICIASSPLGDFGVEYYVYVHGKDWHYVILGIIDAGILHPAHKDGRTDDNSAERQISWCLLRPNVSVSVSHFSMLSLSLSIGLSSVTVFFVTFFSIRRDTRGEHFFFGIQAWSFLSSLFVVRPSIGMRICFDSSQCSVPSSAFL